MPTEYIRLRTDFGFLRILKIRKTAVLRSKALIDCPRVFGGLKRTVYGSMQPALHLFRRENTIRPTVRIPFLSGLEEFYVRKILQ